MRKKANISIKNNKPKKKEEYQIEPFKGGFRCSGSVVMINGTTERIQATARTEEEDLKVDKEN